MSEKIIKKISSITEKKYWPIITFVILTIVLIGLNFEVIKEPYIMMEDGPVFLNGILNNGLKSFFQTYGGYFYLLPRIVALVAVSFGKIFNSAIVMCQVSKFISIFINLYVINYLNCHNFDDIIKNKSIRLILSILLLLFSSNFLAILYCMVSLNWWAGLFTCFCTIQIINGKYPKGFNFILLLISILTTPISFTLVFGIGIYLIDKIKNNGFKKTIKEFDKKVILKMILLLCFLAIQAYAILIIAKDPDGTIITLSSLISRAYLSLKLSLVSVNYIFGTNIYKILNSLGIAIPLSIILWSIIVYYFVKYKKTKYLIYFFGTILLTYVMILFKINDYIGYYQQLLNEFYTIWYHVIPCLLVIFIFAILIENTLNNGKILRSGFVYSLGIITLYVVLNLIKNYNAPDLSYIMNVYQIEPYVEFNSSHTGCLSIPPRWVNWCVDVPVNERYCDDYECIK